MNTSSDSRDHTFISSCALARAISERTPFITASFFAVMSTKYVLSSSQNIAACHIPDGELDDDDDLKKSDMLQTTRS